MGQRGRDPTVARGAHRDDVDLIGWQVSSYGALGLTGVVPTRNTRWIDYVWLSTDSLRPAGSAQFATHRSLDGFSSDHRPMLARIRLYAG